MSTIRYICSGNCNQMVTVERFKQGHKKCVDKSCGNFDKVLDRGEYCSGCNTHFDEGEDHFCI